MKKILLTSALVFVLLLSSVLAVACSSSATAPLQSKIIPASGNAYILTDASTTDDPQGLRDKNFSTQDFINVWYQWDVTGTEQDITVGLVKFDTSSLKGKDIKSATLQMAATGVTFIQSQPIRLVDVSLVDGTFNESTVTWNTKPTWSDPIAHSAVYAAGVWYSWDVSGSVVQKAKDGSEVAYAIGLYTMADKSQEQVLFASTQVAGAVPRLIVTYAASNNALFPMWVWIAVIVVIAIIAFFAGLMITRSRARKAVKSAEPPPAQDEPPAA